MTVAVSGFLQHKDSVVDLASLLAENHETSHNPALDNITIQNVGDSSEVDLDANSVIINSTVAVRGTTSKEIEVSRVTPSPVSTINAPSLPINSITGEANVPTIQRPSPVKKNSRAVAASHDKNFAAVESFEDFENYFNFDPTKVTQPEREFNLFACLFPWLIKTKALKEESDDHENASSGFACLFPWLIETKTLKEESDDHEKASSGQTEETQAREKGKVDEVTEKENDRKLLSIPSSDNSYKVTISKIQDGGNQESPTVSNSVEHSLGDSTTSSTESEFSSKLVLKGILKKPKNNRTTKPATMGRRTLFSTVYVAQTQTKEQGTRHVEFSPMARVTMIESHKNMSTVQMAQIWWRRKDYDDFKRTAQLVTKTILEGGSEVWLMTNPSWRMRGKVKPLPPWPTNKITQDEKRKKDRVNDKWWCKFGHSRRGLEHIASPQEGRERQRNVRKSITRVINEQTKQRISTGRIDPEKIRQVYVRYNSWARVLCLAAATSDEEAVKSNFIEQGRSRDFYLLERQSSDLPEFMKQVPSNPELQSANETIEETIHDASSTAYHFSKKAAGFGTDKDIKMSTVLSGMGVTTQSTIVNRI